MHSWFDDARIRKTPAATATGPARRRLRSLLDVGQDVKISGNPERSRLDVEQVTDAIERVTTHGIVTADGRECPIDTLVCATGFDVAHMLSSVRITGAAGSQPARGLEPRRRGLPRHHSVGRL